MQRGRLMEWMYVVCGSYLLIGFSKLLLRWSNYFMIGVHSYKSKGLSFSVTFVSLFCEIQAKKGYVFL